MIVFVYLCFISIKCVSPDNKMTHTHTHTRAWVGVCTTLIFVFKNYHLLIFFEIFPENIEFRCMENAGASQSSQNG